MAYQITPSPSPSPPSEPPNEPTTITFSESTSASKNTKGVWFTGGIRAFTQSELCCADEDVGPLMGVDYGDLSGRVRDASAATWYPIPIRLTKAYTVGCTVAKLGMISVGKGIGGAQ
ncbi:hypothetical protein FNV43_RR00033 [Rhamnella rubrinervis]|uniref:Uncharacterized protein n=1 Tax=Rhamnella rubrinervis TaxID=2594499 RepID=A0A8K0MRM2_9ROSA|nr:hypothetical protein FNV43_RR00033 [Rhamnella rubrinervis]